MPIRNDEKFVEKHFFLSVIITFLTVLCLLTALLYLSSTIPKGAIRKNLLESISYLEENEDEFYYILENNPRTLIDNYADTIEFNIMYSVSEKRPLENILISSFYSDNRNPSYEMISILKEGIVKEKQPDTIYDRYWHGIQMVVRPLFLFFGLKQIRVIMVSVLLLLLLFLMIRLWKKKQRTLSCSLLVAAAMVSYPMIGMCMEYIPTFLIMFAVCFVCVRYYTSRKMVAISLMVSGICCGFFDILTTETVALVLPLAIVFCLREQNIGLEGLKKEVSFLFLSGGIWAIGYLGVFISKWCFSSLYLKTNRFTMALSMMLYRQQGVVATKSQSGLSQPVEALAKNFRLLLGFPLKMEEAEVLLVTIAITGMISCVVYLYRKTGKECILSILLGILALVPVARILFLHSHSYQHSYFTYRALFATIVCLVTAVEKVIAWDLLKRKDRGLAKRRKGRERWM